MAGKVLAKKLLRTIWNTKGQFLAITAVITIGILVYISMTTTFYNLNRSKDKLYRETGFADYYFHVIKAPQQVTRQVEAVPGVVKVTGRIQKDIPLIKDGNQRGTVRLVSYPLPMNSEVNRVHLLSGRLFEKEPPSGGIEVLVDPQFAAANRLGVNDTITVVAEGRRISLTVVGTATSPEFVYPIKDAASLLPEPETFGIVMLPLNQAQQVLNLPGQVNQLVLKLAPGADEERIAAQVRSILKPYGDLAGYPRKQHLSDVVLQGELDQLRTTARTMPAIFLGIAAAIQFVMLGRMVRTQRLQIGVMKAIGYTSREIIAHYTGYALAAAVSGAVLGTLCGWSLSSAFLKLYAEFFNLPETVGGIHWQTVAYGFLLSLGVGTTAGLLASHGIVTINPAESMRPEPPKGGGRVFLERWARLWQRLDPSWKMGLRTVLRNRMRSGVTLVGVIFAVGLLIIAVFSKDSVDYILREHFHRQQHYDYLVRFTAPVKEYELLNLSRIDGVVRAEPILEVPVRMHFQGRSREDILLGLPPDVSLKELVNDTGQRMPLPEEGMLISQRTAEKLGVQAGDRVIVETLLGFGPSRTAGVKVAGINSQLIGSASYVTLEQANRALQERQLVSGTMLKVDPGKAEYVEKQLNDMTGVSSILSRQKELAAFNKNLDSLVYSIAVMVAFAAVLGFAIVYNSAVISFAERKRELASLRVVGFTAREVSGLLFKENLLQTLLGVALGLPFGRMMAEAFIKASSSDLFTLPVVIYPSTYFIAALGGIFFIWVAHLFAAKGVKRLDLVEVLTSKD
ncbi:MAG: FtsX-like permease family protein [Bacillota bacterium]|uniref:ABC transporter permease n=1 Tax=Desulforudis sp. DRI-14 TaxID=3459793 RepID=UPI003480E076